MSMTPEIWSPEARQDRLRELRHHGRVGAPVQPIPTLAETEVEAIIQAEFERPRFQLYTAQEMKQGPRPRPLVDGYLHQGELSALIGQEESYKTFIALDLALSVAAGIPWLSTFDVHQGPVVYISAEGSEGLGPRIDAWEKARGIVAPDACQFLPDAVQLINAADVDKLLLVVQRLPVQPTLVVIDTLARCFVGGDENSAQDMGRLIAGADRVRRTLGSNVMLLHHFGKSGNSPRGSGALLGALDTRLDVEADRQTRHVTITCQKQKNAPRFKAVHLLGRVIPLDGDPEGSLVFDLTDHPVGTVRAGARRRTLGTPTVSTDSGESLTDAQQRLLDAFPRHEDQAEKESQIRTRANVSHSTFDSYVKPRLQDRTIRKRENVTPAEYWRP
jgi:hypothetical protein